MSKKHSSWKDNEIFYCHLLTKNLDSFSAWQLIDGPTRRWMSFLHVSFVDAFKMSSYMCRTLNPLDQLHKKWMLCIVIKTSFVYCSLNSANPYTFKHLNNGGSIQNDNTESKCDFFNEELIHQSQSVASQPNYEAFQAFLHRPQEKKEQSIDRQ